MNGISAGGDQVAAAQLDRVDPELGRDDVEHALAHEGGLGHPRAAVGADRRGRRHHAVRDERERLPAVRAGKVPGRQQRRQDPLRADVGALVDPVRAAEAEQRPVGLRRHLELVHLRAGVVGGDEVLRPVLDPPHGPADAEGEQRDEDVLGVELAAGAEAAADVDLDEPHALRLEPEQAGDHRAVEVLHLGGAVHGHAAVAGGLGEEAAGLDRRSRLAREAERAADDHGRPRRTRRRRRRTRPGRC